MAKISFDEKIARAFLSGSVPDIKGSTKITLADPKTGRREVFHDTNMVTDAITRIFKSNFLGMTDYCTFVPFHTLFGGVMCFAQPLTESASSFWPVNGTISAMTANAGQTAHSTATPTRGNPDGAATEINSNYIRMAWSWSLSQGNGPISAVCLTHALAGDCGLYPDGTMPLIKSTGFSTRDVNCVLSGNIPDNVLDRSRTLGLPIALDDNGNGISLYFNGTTLEEITTAHSFVNADLLGSAGTIPLAYPNYREIQSRSATLSRTFTTGYTYLAQDANSYYVMERASGSTTTLYIDIVSKTDMSVTSKTCTVSGIALARPAADKALVYSGIVSAGSVYWIDNTDAKNFVRININNNADVEQLTTHMTDNIALNTTPIVLNDGLIVGRNFLINGSDVYQVTGRTARSVPYSESVNTLAVDVMAKFKNGPHMLQSAFTNTSNAYTYAGQGGNLILPYLATVNNLVTPVTKTNSKTMEIEYTLTEV